MTLQLPADRMPEAEVLLRLAFHLLGSTGSGVCAKVGIDGAQVEIHATPIFPWRNFSQTMTGPSL